MSKQGGDKGHWDPNDPSLPSTSGGHRSKTPYSRPSGRERGHSGRKEKIKSVTDSSDTDASATTYSRSYSRKEKIKSVTDSSDTDASATTYSRSYSRSDYSDTDTSYSRSYESRSIKSELVSVKSEPIKSEMETMSESDDTTATSSKRSETSEDVKPGPSQVKKFERKDSIFVSRPIGLDNKKGTSGRKVMLQSNHFKLITLPNWDIHLYRVDFEPDETRTPVRKGMLRFHHEAIGPYIFDGTMLFSPHRLGNESQFTTMRKSDGACITITLRYIGPISPEDPRYIVFFSITMRRCLEHLKLQLVGYNYYDARNKVCIYKHKLELWPGYATSIKRHEQEIMMGVEITHRVLRQDSLLHILRDIRARTANFQEAFKLEVLGITVLTDYNDRTYRIEDVDFNVNPKSTFCMKDEEISYMSYYKKKYGITLSNDTQPMLVTRSKPKVKYLGKGDLVYLVPELCRPVGIPENMKSNFAIMRDLATHTRISPQARIEKLLMFNNRLRKEEKVVQELQNWNLTLDKYLVNVPGRVLNPERLIFGRNFNISSGQGDWTREMQKAPLLVSKELRQWVVIVHKFAHHNLTEFLGKLQFVSRNLDFRVAQPEIITVHDDTTAAFVNALEHFLSKRVPDMVFCVLNTLRRDRYIAIKKKCCLERPVPSQVILQKSLQGRNAMTIATKVAIQMNCKLGGAPWKIDLPIRGAMIIGIDICRDSHVKGREYLSMIATVDTDLTQYFTYVSLYRSHDELGEQISEGVRQAAYAYRLKYKALPMHLLIYRDGVSEGQMENVYNNEVNYLKKKLEVIYFGPNYKMVYTIVTKNNVRFFNDKYNPSIGTVVDDVVTCPFKFDFFLVSQGVRQGTVTPTAYNVLHDNSGLSPDMIQLLTFKLTHMYYNCSSTVRTPSPCHYAKKLSVLVGQFLHQPPNTNLQNQLYFL